MSAKITLKALRGGDSAPVSADDLLVIPSAQVRARAVLVSGVPIYTTRLERIGGISRSDLPTAYKVEHVEPLLRDYFEGKDREELVLVLMDRENHIIGLAQVAVGASSYVPIEWPTLLRPVILSGAAGVISVHNHPASSAEPSDLDVRAHQQTARMLNALGVRHHDSLIVSEDSVYSFRRNGTPDPK